MILTIYINTNSLTNFIDITSFIYLLSYIIVVIKIFTNL